MQNQLIISDKDVNSCVSELIDLEPKFLKAVSVCGVPKIRKANFGFEALFRIMVGQQLSTIVANSIWKKLVENNLTKIDSISVADDLKLRVLGLSNKKISYVRGLAAAEIDYESMIDKSDSDIIQELIGLNGIGVWTAQIYLIFSLRRADIFASGDLALKEGVRALFDLNERPSERDLDQMSQPWSPVRTIASLITWNYYNYLKRRKDP